MYFWYLTKFLLSHESRSIAILDHFQSWKSLQHRLEGWEGEIKVSLFTPSSGLRSARQPADISPLALLHPSSLMCSILHFHLFHCNFVFSILNVMCGGYCHLMNVLSTSPSSLILIHFRGSMPQWLGQKNAFNIEIVWTIALITLINFCTFFHFLSGCNLVLTFSLDYDLFEIQIFCNLHPGSVIPDTWQDQVREEMMPPLQCTVLFSLCILLLLLQGSVSYEFIDEKWNPIYVSNQKFHILHLLKTKI